MKKTIHACLATALTGVLLLGLLSGCLGKADPTPTPTPSVSASPTAAPDERETVRVAVLNGPSGMGAAWLMAQNELGVTQNRYEFTVFTDNTQVTAALTSGTVDVAAMASNLAANLYHKTDGGVQMAAVTGLGVLKILQTGLKPGENTISSLDELEGHTIYATGQGANPEYVLNYLLEESGLDPETDVDIQWMTPEEVTQGMLAGETQFAMLPVPMANVLIRKNVIQSDTEAYTHLALDLNDVWEQATSEGELTMTALVVRADYAKEKPEAVHALLNEYKSSVKYMTDPMSMAVSSDMNPGRLLEKYELAPAAVAPEALADANLTFISGMDNLRNAIQGYYEVLYAANPASIGGGIPDDNFYFE